MLIRLVSFQDADNLLSHLDKIIEESWIRGYPLQMTRTQKRLANVSPPCMYASSAARSADEVAKRSENRFISFCGALLPINGVVQAKLGVFLDNVTNNEAEYNGATFMLIHVLKFPCRRVYVRVDSMLVVQQLNAVWSCKRPRLKF